MMAMVSTLPPPLVTLNGFADLTPLLLAKLAESEGVILSRCEDQREDGHDGEND